MKRLLGKQMRCSLIGLLCACLFMLNVSADVIQDGDTGETTQQVMADTGDGWDSTATVAAPVAVPAVAGKAALLMDADSGQVLFADHEHDPLPIASVTKVMTLLLIMEAIDAGQLRLDETVTASATAAGMGGSQIWLKENESMTVSDLLKAIAVVSANDACAAMAEHLCGSIEGFVALMNQRAQQLGMKDTHFLDCTGLSDDTISSAYDVAVMSRELLKHPLITQYTTIWMDTIRGGASQLVNTNKLVRFYPGATGLKTGTTAAAGSCLSASASRDGLSLIAVVLGASTSDDRFSTCRKLLDYGFANYTVYTPTWNDSLMQPIPVQHGLLDSVPLLAPDTDGLLVPKADVSRVMVTVDRQALLTAPILSGQQVGRVVVSLDGTEIASYPLRAAFEVPRLTFGRAFAWLWAAVMG